MSSWLTFTNKTNYLRGNCRACKVLGLVPHSRKKMETREIYQKVPQLIEESDLKTKIRMELKREAIVWMQRKEKKEYAHDYSNPNLAW